MKPPTNPQDRALIEETLRLYRRYQQEVVEQLNLCPWAKRARLDGQVEIAVILEPTPTLTSALEHIQHWSTQPAIEIGLLLYPCFEGSRRRFERWVAELVEADRKRHHLQSPAFAMAPFHRDAPLDLKSKERLVPYWRRTPDPTVQLVRISALERVREHDTGGTHYFDTSQLDFSSTASLQDMLNAPSESLRERVAHANLSTLESWGAERVSALFEDIMQDHARTRARLGREKP